VNPPEPTVSLSELRRARRRANPGSILSREIIIHELAAFLSRVFPVQSESVLDLGAGTRPYAPLYEPYFQTATSVDVDYSRHDISRIDVIASADALPFEDEAFDCVICTEVLEHCPDPWAAAAEITRVLRPGGWLFLSTPFLLPLHEMPHDYQRFTPPGLEALAKRAGLTVEEITPRGDYTAVALSNLLLPVSKGLQQLGKVIGAGFYTARNPIVWTALVAPQRLYFEGWKRVRQRPNSYLARIYRRLTYYTLGYVTVARRAV
jgi:SAM-dependent methyltransferase